MAFFTRVNYNIPVLPSQNEKEPVASTSNNNNVSDKEIDEQTQEDSSSTKRYEYVVDRVLGVEV